MSARLNTTVQATLNLGDLRQVPIALPPESVRDAITAFAASLDDKIAVNDRIAATSEMLALALASELRWLERVPLGALVHHRKDQIQLEALGAAQVDHYSLPAFDAGKIPVRESAVMIKSGKFVIRQQSVLLSKLNPATPRIWIAEPTGVPALASTEYLVLEPIEGLTTADVWAAASQPSFREDLVSKATGTSNSHQRVRPSDLLDTKVTDPRSIDPRIRSQIRTLAQIAQGRRAEGIVLAELRDTLLPKLMSGEIRIKGAEKIVGEAT